MDKRYILDTSVILDNPDCISILRNGIENEIIIPYSVIRELDKLKRKPDLAHVVSEIGTMLEGDERIVYIKHEDALGGTQEEGDERIFAEIKDFIERMAPSDRNRTIVVSNDKFFRIRLRIEGVQVQEFKFSHPIFTESQIYTGFVDQSETPLANSFSWVDGRPFFHGREPRPIDHENTPWGISPRNIYQNLAMELMLEPEIDIVSVQSQAGYGKTYLALACALEMVLSKPKRFDKLYIVKPNIEIGEKLGFLPGEIEDKLEPYFKPIEDLLFKLHEQRPANRVFEDQGNGSIRLNPQKCEILPLNFVRGMNLENCVVVIDEAQNLTRIQARTLLTRMGHGVKCFVLGDTDQVDHPYLNRYNNGLNWIVKQFKGHRNYGHIVLKGAKSRGPITDLVLASGL